VRPSVHPLGHRGSYRSLRSGISPQRLFVLSSAFLHLEARRIGNPPIPPNGLADFWRGSMAGQAQRTTSRRNGKSLAELRKENANLKKQLKAREHELTETRDQQTAVRDVLKVISRSSFDLQPVLEIVTETAARLVGADMAAISRREGDVFRFTVGAGTTPETAADIARLRPFYEQHPFVPGRGTIAGRVALEGRAVQIEDITADPDYEFSAASTVAKMRSVLGVPLMREGIIVGTLTLARQRVEPFTVHQIDLVQTFADQAVIAIENARLITETRQALEQQTATAEVLGVINTSPGDLAPVFDAMLEKRCVSAKPHLDI
jgi:two-component system, NtrC family, sensor kinase